MGLFGNLFGKKQTGDITSQLTEKGTVQLQEGDTFISTGDNYGFKIIRPLAEHLKERIDKSTILLRTGQLYMHYWTDNLVSPDRDNPEWQNKVMFFWKAGEAFPKKSLPAEFETFQKKHFLFRGDASKISMHVGQAAPWFGMPGLGDKHFCEMNGQKVTIPELSDLGLVEYVEQVELTNDNADMLTNREEYFFLIDDRVTTFQNGNFYLKDKPVSIDLVYSIGGINLVKKTTLQ